MRRRRFIPRFTTRQLLIAATLCCLLLGNWTAANLWGVHQVEAMKRNALGKTMRRFVQGEGLTEAPVYKIENVRAVFPCGIAVDAWHHESGGNGACGVVGYREHYFWLFGFHCMLRKEVFWAEYI